MKTPYAVICKQHGQQFLTEEQYNHQMDRPDAFWYCPVCHQEAEWDDDNYDEHMYAQQVLEVALSEGDVYTLIGYSKLLKIRGEEDMSNYFIRLAIKIAKELKHESVAARLTLELNESEQSTPAF